MTRKICRICLESLPCDLRLIATRSAIQPKPPDISKCLGKLRTLNWRTQEGPRYRGRPKPSVASGLGALNLEPWTTELHAKQNPKPEGLTPEMICPVHPDQKLDVPVRIKAIEASHTLVHCHVGHTHAHALQYPQSPAMGLHTTRTCEMRSPGLAHDDYGMLLLRAACVEVDHTLSASFGPSWDCHAR